MADERTGAGLISFEHVIMSFFDTRTATHLRTIYDHRYEPEYSRVFADLYWRALLILACIAIVGAGICGASIFFGALPTSAPDVSVNASDIAAGSNLDRLQLDATLNSFTAREEKFRSLQTAPIPLVPDPSK